MRALALVAVDALVPELSAGDWRASVDLCCRLPGFTEACDRPPKGFAFLVLGRAQLMVDQIGSGRDLDNLPRERPFGLGPDLQIRVDALGPSLRACTRPACRCFSRPRSAGAGAERGPPRRRRASPTRWGRAPAAS